MAGNRVQSGVASQSLRADFPVKHQCSVNCSCASRAAKKRIAGSCLLVILSLGLPGANARAVSPAVVADIKPPYIEANPNPIGLRAGQPMGSTTVRWDAGGMPAEVRLSANGRQEQVFGNSSAGQREAPWISPGAVYEFRLYKTTAPRELLAQVRVTASATSAFIDASPNPVRLPAPNDKGATTVRWDAKSPVAQVYLFNGKKEEFFSGASAGQQQAPWISAGGSYEFRLYRGTERGELLAKVRVTGIAPEREASSVSVPSVDASESWFGSVERAIAVYCAALCGALALAMLAGMSGTLLGPKEGRSPSGLAPLRMRLAKAAAPVAVFLVAGALGCGNLGWLSRFRAQGPLGNGESQLLVAGFDLEGQFLASGLEGFWRQLSGCRPNGPLQPLATCLLTSAVGREVLQGFVVVQLFYVALIVATFGIGRRMGGMFAGVLAALIVATAPGVIAASRVLDGSIAMAAVFAAATWALLKSNQLRNRQWSAAWGSLAAVAALANSAAVFLVVAQFLAAGQQIVSIRQDRRSRLAHFVFAGAISLATSCAWYAANFDCLWVGPGEAPGGESGIGALYSHFQLPLTVVLAGVSLAGIAALVRTRRGAGISDLALRFTQSDFAVLALSTTIGWAALSVRAASGGVLALLPAVAAVATSLACKASGRWFRSLAAGLLAAIAVYHLVAASGAGQHEAEASRADAEFGAWRAANDGALALIEGRAGAGLDDVSIVVWSRERYLSCATLRLFDRLNHSGEAIIEDASFPRIDSFEAWRKRLEQHNPGANAYFIATTPLPAEGLSAINLGMAEKAATAAGFAMIRDLQLPNGRKLRVWERKK
jgi:hypothetical protein